MNLQQLQNEVLAHGFDQTAYGARIINYLNDAVAKIVRRVDYYVDEASQTYQTVAGVTDITVPPNWARTRSLLNTDLEEELTQVGLRDIDRAAVTSGVPNCYAQDGSSLRLYPTPDGAYNLLWRYWLMPTPLANPTDTPTLPADYHSALTEYAIGRCYAGDDDIATGDQWNNRFLASVAEFEADQRFPSTDAPTQAKSMWGGDRLGKGGWSRWPEGY